MDTHARLQQLLRERGWTEYKLSKECGLAQSTIGNIVRRNTVPSVSTLETICRGFGITMSQFFAEADILLVSLKNEYIFKTGDYNINIFYTLVLQPLIIKFV